MIDGLHENENPLCGSAPRVPRKSGAVGSVEREAEFMLFIKSHANPTRVKAGLAEISEEEARAAFKMMEENLRAKGSKPNSRK